MSLIDYSIGRSFIESFMSDSCTVTRLAGGVGAQVLDPVTGHLVDPPGSVTAVYSGKCLIKRPKLENQPQNIAGQYSNYAVYKIMVPVHITDLQFGDIFTVIASSDRALLAHKMRIVDVWAGTHDVYRAAWAIDLTTGLLTED